MTLSMEGMTAGLPAFSTIGTALSFFSISLFGSIFNALFHASRALSGILSESGAAKNSGKMVSR